MVAVAMRVWRNLCRPLALLMLWLLLTGAQAMAEQKILVLDDRNSGDLSAGAGNAWRFVSDTVMGGVSRGRLLPDSMAGRDCLRLQGEVSLDNNGGFVQGALGVPENVRALIAGYRGIVLDAHGNGEDYNVHLRTRDLWLPWQSFRSTFTALPQWQRLYLPFSDFKPYRTGKALDTAGIERIGIVAIGRAFSADLCIGMLGLYQ